MGQRRFHYDRAFEHYLRAKAIPYVSVDEARKALHGYVSLKSFDFVVYGADGRNLLVDVKGRKHGGRSTRQLDNWVTEDDVTCLTEWQKIFGKGFRGALVFLYWCDEQPPDALFHEIFEFGGRWYAVLAAEVDAYREHMKQRSPKWQTMHVPAEAWQTISRPLVEML